MSRIKLCGLSRTRDVEAANELEPDYVGFVFAPKSKRCVMPDEARMLRSMLVPGITTVGVFVNEKPEQVAVLLNAGIIDVAQLHGDEDGIYVRQLRELTDKPLIQAFRIISDRDADSANESTADYVLLDSGAGTGTTFDWRLAARVERPYFLAGGLNPGNVAEAIRRLDPYAVDVSSGIETDGVKDVTKMAAFVAAVRSERNEDHD